MHSLMYSLVSFTEQFTSLKNSQWFMCSIHPPQKPSLHPLETTKLFVVLWICFSRMAYSWDQTAHNLFRLASFIYFSLKHAFVIYSCLLMAWWPIPLYSEQYHNLSIVRLKGMLVESVLNNYKQNCYKLSHTRFLCFCMCEYNFPSELFTYLGEWLPDCMVWLC